MSSLAGTVGASGRSTDSVIATGCGPWNSCGSTPTMASTRSPSMVMVLIGHPARCALRYSPRERPVGSWAVRRLGEGEVALAWHQVAAGIDQQRAAGDRRVLQREAHRV